jgi:hypothetical protein
MRAKRLCLSGVASLIAVGGTQAADIPLKAKLVEYVKICDLYGRGFFYIPGTDTCLQIGGWARYDTYFNQNSSNNPPIGGGAGGNNRAVSPDYSTRSTMFISFDARSPTEYGTLRAFYRAGMDLATGLTSQYANGTYYNQRAFLQLSSQTGVWTAGRSQSFFDIFAQQWGYGAAFLGAGSQTGPYGTNVAAYTAIFGNGLSATLALEDGNTRRSYIWDATAGPAVAGAFPSGIALPLGAASIGPMGPATNGDSCGAVPIADYTTIANNTTTNGVDLVGCGWGNYAAQQFPDIVGNLRVDQAWGSAQISGALHQVRANNYGNNFVVAAPTYSGAHPDDVWGGAVAAGIQFNMPWNAGDKVWAEGTYAMGAVSYMGFARNSGINNAFARYDGGFASAGMALDAVMACYGGGIGTSGVNGLCTRSGLQLSTSWSVSAAFEHYWTPALRTSFYGSYAFWTPGSTGNNIMCAAPGAPVRSTLTGAAPDGNTALAGCNFSFASWGFGSRTVWNPINNLYIGTEVLYQQLDNKMDPNLVVYSGGGSGARPTGLYKPASEGAVVGMVRVNRFFCFEPVPCK